MKVRNYRVEIERLSDEEGGGFLASIPELPGCSSDGDTRAEAIAGLEEAIDSWIAMAAKLGREVPAPQRVYA
jgi:predicted RNase H-like HicB family nuclease